MTRFIPALIQRARSVFSRLSTGVHCSLILALQPAPETEGEMMIEIFKYTERVVNMVRPRKLLFMAIGEFAFDVYDVQPVTTLTLKMAWLLAQR